MNTIAPDKENGNPINNSKRKTTVILLITMSILALFASLEGIINKRVYASVIDTGVMLKSFMAGTIAQDIISVAAGLLLLVLSIIFIKKANYKIFITILGLAGYFLYGYGLYVITGLYTSIYIVYLVIFTLSIFGLIWGLTSFPIDRINNYTLPLALGRTIGIFLGVIVVVFVSLWLISIIPYSLKSIRPDFYGVYVMDLCIIMPAFSVIAFGLLRKQPFSNILGGVSLIVLITLCLSLAIGEPIAMFYGVTPDYGMIAIFSTLTLISLILEVFYLLKYRKA